MHRVRRYLMLSLIALSAVGLLGAGDNTRRFEKLGHNLVCTCGCNQILLECNHVGCPASSSMRDELTAALDKNLENDAVLAGFVTKYGPTVLAAPTNKGFDRVAWVMPFAVLVLGVMAVVFISREWRQRAPAVAASAQPLPDALRTRIRQETEE
jgi:cytochrome c-type biogenesis protein CcmH/NrfF